jgi:hypothetical protein
VCGALGNEVEALHDWVLYAKPVRRAGSERIRFVGNGSVRFVWKDYADHTTSKELSRPAEEFPRRFLLHVMPRGFMRIRHYGILANRHREQKLGRCRELLGVPTSLPPHAPLTMPDRDPPRDVPDELATERPLPPCPICGALMRVVELLAPRPSDTS